MKKTALYSLFLLLSLNACQSGARVGALGNTLGSAPVPLTAPAPQLSKLSTPAPQPGSFQFTSIKNLNIQFTGGMSYMRISVEYQLNRGEKAFKRQVQFKYLLASKEVTEIVVVAGDRGSAEELKQECAAIMRLQIKQ